MAANPHSTASIPPPPNKLRIFSLNCWGLKYLAAHRNARLTEIGVQIASVSPAPDIVGLQECWTQEDYLSIRSKTSHILPYGKFYYSGIFGGGLAILSRWPIEESTMYRYPLNGRPAAFYRGDWFVGKGVACARIRMGPGKRDMAEVFCTHLHAPYEREPHDSYIVHRTAQAWEITKLMRHASERGHLVIGLGDFNMVPLSLAHQLIESHSPVRDVWRVINPTSSLGAAKDDVEKRRLLEIGEAVPNAGYNIGRNGTTCDSALNTWRWEESLKKRLNKGENITVEDTVQDPNAKRLDYIFAASGPYPVVSATDASNAKRRNEWMVEDVNVGMTGRHPTLHCSLSDHFSVECTLVRDDLVDGLQESEPLISPLPSSTYSRILDLTSVYTTREHRQRTLRIGHFYFQLLLTMACLVGVWWSPHNYVSFILMLLSSLGLATGVVDGLMGFLFVGSEERALKEFSWEVERAKTVAEQVEREREDGKGQ